MKKVPIKASFLRFSIVSLGNPPCCLEFKCEKIWPIWVSSWLIETGERSLSDWESRHPLSFLSTLCQSFQLCWECMRACFLYSHPHIPWTFDAHRGEHTYPSPLFVPSKWRYDHVNICHSLSSFYLYSNPHFHPFLCTFHDKLLLYWLGNSLTHFTDGASNFASSLHQHPHH